MILDIFGDAKGGAMFEARPVQEYLEMASDPARRKGELMHQMVIGESRRQVHHLGYAMAPETHRHQFMATEGQTYQPSEHTGGKVSQTRRCDLMLSSLTALHRPHSAALPWVRSSFQGQCLESPSSPQHNSSRP